MAYLTSTFLTGLFDIEIQSGNMDAISSVAGVIGDVSVFVISLVGFGIVMSSILKNAIHGLYATNPRFFDKVHTVRENGIQVQNDKFKQVAAVGSFVLRMVPDVKGMTEFAKDEDGNAVTIDAKQWFSRSLPLMVAQIFIGMLIFFGYPGRIAEQIGTFGTQTIDIVLNNVDPMAWVEKLPTQIAIYSISTDGALDSESQQINTIAKKSIKTVLGAYPEIPKSIRGTIANEIETWIIEEVKVFSEYCDKEKYNMEAKSTIANSVPDLTRINTSDGKNPRVSDSGMVTYAFYTELSQFVGDGRVTSDYMGRYLRVDLIFTPIAQANKSKSVESKLQVPNGKTSWNESSASTIVITADGSEVSAEFVAQSGAKGSAGGKTVTITASGNTIQLSNTKDGLEGVTQITEISGLAYYYNGIKHPIRTLVREGSEFKFVPVDQNSSYNAWKWGEAPTLKVQDSTTE